MVIHRFADRGRRRADRRGVTLLLAPAALCLLAACGGPHTVGQASPTPGSPISNVASTVTAAPSDPVLGRADNPRARGLGTSRPSLIDPGGADSSGIIEHVTWTNWGGPTATGSGDAGWVAPGAPLASATQERATLVASDLGPCHGRPAYRTLNLHFPRHGGKTASRSLPICAN